MGIITEIQMQPNDIYWMEKALEEARKAGEQEEVPVGAVIVQDNQLIGSGSNSPIGSCDATCHAEINAIRSACTAVKNYRLPGACLYVTLEPCTMCIGAVIHSRIERVVFATPEPRAGAIISAAALDFAPYNHSLLWTQGILQQESSLILKTFFQSRR